MRNGNIIERAVHFILSRGDEELSSLKLKDAAGAAGAVIAHFYIKFLLDQKRTFRSFVEREKLWRVLFHLDQDPDIEIEALSDRLGFSTTAEFEDRFKVDPFVK
ncbi:MAG: hypothetical protein KAW12_12220, partial [Candidatus Aminicenantes bacterium]|nr:hypothetical protein [Candidatus Aminicenantes bacterium]